MRKDRGVSAGLRLALGLALATAAISANSQSAPALTAGEAADVALEAYSFGYPMIQGYPSLARHAAGGSPGLNELSHARQLAPVDRPGMPQRDALESLAVIDLRREPLVLSLPEVPAGQGYLVQLLDTSGELLPYLGSHGPAGAGGDYALVGPGFHGILPAQEFDGVITSNGLFVTLRARVLILDPADLSSAHAVQDGMYLRPLSAFLDSEAPPEAPAVSWLPWDAQQASGIGVFDYLNTVMAYHPPAPREADAMARFARIGVIPGQRFRAHAFPDEIAADMEAALAEGREALDDAAARVDRYSGSWHWDTRDRTRFGSDYLRRAAAAHSGLYPEQPELLMIGRTGRDANGEPLTGERGVRIRFPAAAMPPVSQLWSLSLYDAGSGTVYHNEEKRYSVGSTSSDLLYDEDGSLALYIGHIEPSDPALRRNWLPAPRGNIQLVLRLYGPEQAVLSGDWTPPTVLPADR